MHNCDMSCRLKILAASRREKLNDSLTLQQFYRSVDDEESWIKYVFPILEILHDLYTERKSCWPAQKTLVKISPVCRTY